MLRTATTHAALTTALSAAARLISDGLETTAVGCTGSAGLMYADDYWTADLALPSGVYEVGHQFERTIATQAQKRAEKYGALVVPVIYRDGVGAGAEFRNPRKEMVDGETCALFAITWDIREGFDLHRLLYTHRPNGDAVFGDTQTLNGATRLPSTAPGSALIQSVLHPGGSPA